MCYCHILEIYCNDKWSIKVTNSFPPLAAQGLLAVGGGACLTSYTRSVAMVSEPFACDGVQPLGDLTSWWVFHVHTGWVYVYVEGEEEGSKQDVMVIVASHWVSHLLSETVFHSSWLYA